MKNKNVAVELVIFSTLVALVVLGRLLSHTPNFTPVAAVALFSGFFFRREAIGLIAVSVGMLLSDAFLGFYDLRMMIVVYGCLLCPVLLRYFLQGRALALRIATCALASSTVFFLVTNLAVWIFSGMYSHTLEGIRDCYTAAIPFGRFTFLGDLFWSGVLFGSYALIRQFKHISSLTRILLKVQQFDPCI